MPASGLDLDLLVHGAEIREMLTYTDTWVHRRVEQIAFVDDRTVSRRVSVDYQLPRRYVGADLQQQRWYVPLALLRKGTLLVDFDLRDEEGRALPLVTSRKAHEIGSAVLINAASTVLKKTGRSLGVELAQDLQRVPPCELEKAKEAVRRALEPRSANDDRRILRNDPLIEPLIRDLAENFLVLVPAEVTTRSVVKFSFLQFIRDRHQSPLIALGWQTLVFRLNMAGAAMARSYHCEISAPERLELTQGRLSALTGKEVRYARRTRSRRRVHFQIDGVSSMSQCVLQVGLRASRRGLPWMSALLAVGISTLLTIGLVFLGAVLGSNDEAAPALLVAIPALLAAYLSAPGEHMLASRLLTGIRWLTGLAGLLVFVAAASLVAGEEHETTVRIVWIAAAGLSWLLSLALISSALLPRPDRSLEATP